ncbi:winged helix-turn-helix domain-containing protein [Luteimonas sp. BDR2-5]|uniref:protein kinase domain-containing protein n=1 Tax=Proluteimonas luteida TaxID=2878685 RepID=UPI001E3B830C|nr:winged helix-turn-helix domain-containing protein [Luteimonas sp. BDR2-5]MCD9029845.1 winged helix-turn-helix domain-containing protein [Luteimonas sp. BDR2-5]
MPRDPAVPRDTRLYRWRFGAVEFDEARYELRLAGLPVEIEHKPLQVLALLLRHAGEVVTKEELFDTVWAGRVTVDHVLATAIGKLRKALDASGEGRITTVPRIGYRFGGPVERIAVGQRLGGELKFEAGQPVPGREHFLLERPLAQTLGSEVWLARQPRSRESRVFKFSPGGEQLSAIKREATLMRVLRDTLGERADFVRVIDWNFESEPYFLECEYGGEALPDWTANHDLLAHRDQAERLDFFLQIARAVDAAHGVGVLHKDIKPANVLVRQRPDGRWQACLTDFGNSRLLQPERLAELGITGLGLTLTGAGGSDGSGTPLYLAPELIAGQPPTVRSDLYALGILLYQWMAGDLRRPMAPGWERDIADPLLVEDITRATDGDPSRRLGSVAELIERLSSLPRRREDAQRSAAVERAAQVAQRALEQTQARRPWIVATIAVLSVGLLASTLFWQRSEQQRRTAAMQAARAEAVARFLSDDLLGALSPGGTGFERDPGMREVLEHASAQIADRFADDPAMRGGVHAALGQAWRTLGDRERAVRHMQEAERHYALAFGEADELTLKTRYTLARNLAYANAAEQFAEAGRLLDATDHAAGTRLQGDSELALEAAYARGVFHFQQLQIDPALEAYRRADRLQRLVRPDDALTAATIRENLADAALRQGDLKGATAQLRAMLADPLFDAGRIGEGKVAGHRIMLARALRNLGRYEEALPLAESAAAVTERILGPDDYSTLIQLSTVASIHDYAGDCGQALPIARTVRERMAARYGEERQATLIETGNLGFKERDCGDREAGLDYLRQAETGLRKHYGEDNVAAHSFRYALANALADEGQYSEALRMAEGLSATALTAGDSTPGWEHRLRALRGRILLLSGDAAAGLPLLTDATHALVALGTEDDADIAQLQALLAGDRTVAGK